MTLKEFEDMSKALDIVRARIAASVDYYNTENSARALLLLTECYEKLHLMSGNVPVQK
jgi:hypothetical protein